MATTYTRVREILNDAVGDAEPGHDGHGKFWCKSLEEFLAIEIIYTVVPIADPGPNRGARSGLIHALRGEPPFDGSEYSRMPMGLPPVPDELIDYIQTWIDEGCPA